MIFTTKELYEKYKNYKAPHIKIRTEVFNQRLFEVVRGLYESDCKTPGYLLTSYICSQAYLSFEYVLMLENIIPERVYTYTAATALKEHSRLIQTSFGNFLFQDIPVSAYMYGINVIRENGYTYLMATKEKALCDLLYKKRAVSSMKEFKSMLFEDLRIDEEGLRNMNRDDIKFLCPLYRKKNLKFLNKYMEGI